MKDWNDEEVGVELDDILSDLFPNADSEELEEELESLMDKYLD